MSSAAIARSNVAITMGSKSDYELMQEAATILIKFKAPREAGVISTHRKPDRAHHLATGAHSVVITNTAPQPPFTVAMGQAQYPDIQSTMQLLAGRVKKLIAFDAASLATRAGSSLSLNMVMLGALARSEATGISPDMFRGVVRTKTKSAFTDINLKAFDFGMSAID